MNLPSLFRPDPKESEYFKFVRTLEGWEGFRNALDAIYQEYGLRDRGLEGQLGRSKHPVQFAQAVNELFVFALLKSNGLQPERVADDASPDFFLPSLNAYCEATAPKLDSLSTAEADDEVWRSILLDVLRERRTLAQYGMWFHLEVKNTAGLTSLEAASLPDRLQRTLGRGNIQPDEDFVIELESGAELTLTARQPRTPRGDGSAIGSILGAAYWEGEIEEQCTSGLAAKQDTYRDRTALRPLLVAVSAMTSGGDPAPAVNAAESFFEADDGVVDGLIYISRWDSLQVPDRVIHVPRPNAVVPKLQLSHVIDLS